MTKLLKQYGDCIGPLSFPMKDQAARELEKMLDTGEYSPLTIQKSVTESILEGERSDVSIISDASPDREGELIDPATLDFTEFRNNPIVAFNHRYDLPPVGKSLWQKHITNSNTWKAKTQYFSRPENHPQESEWFPDSIFHLVQNGGMKGKSVGGAVKWREPTQEDADKFRFSLNDVNRISEKAIVYEYSCCPLAMNKNAVVEAVTQKSIQLGDEIIQHSFPEIWELVLKARKDEKPEELTATFCKTFDDYQAERKEELKKKMSDFELSVPNFLNEVIARELGRVEI